MEALNDSNTTGAVKAATPRDFDPEFLDHRGVTRIFSIKRSHAYVLAGRGDIKSVSLRQRGAIKGRRLFNAQSIRDYLNRVSAEREVA